MELWYKKGRPLLLETNPERLHLHVGRGPTKFDLSLFVAVIVVWIFSVTFIRDPFHHLMLLLLIPLGPRAFGPLVKTDVEILGDGYTVRKSLLGIGPRWAGAIDDLRVDFEREGLYDGAKRIAPLTPELADMVLQWLKRHGRRGSEVTLH